MPFTFCAIFVCVRDTHFWVNFIDIINIGHILKLISDLLKNNIYIYYIQICRILILKKNTKNININIWMLNDSLEVLIMKIILMFL